MSIRAAQIYIGSDTKRSLHMIARATEGLTADELGDTLIRAALKRDYPQLGVALEEIKAIERRVTETYRLFNEASARQQNAAPKWPYD